ncbi:hypothetical protein [Streptomyces shenzhenensis]|uniref:Uncharacterized protein n=1 Tax=Streptomyces shenzhenensis TaxID=943815 RepID=A0A3M0IGZ0_9ACTN|nr:hypothetical protein [Streptomyces shenzhenensis]RMB87628.1 hypothetical protein CTZ28_01315 [Streptomyces shenzhenensis]
MAAERKESLPSPWRWNEAEASELTELADLLADRHVTVALVDVRYDQEGVWRRVDLGAWLVGEGSSPEPGVPLGAVKLSQLADFVAYELHRIDAAEYWEPEAQYGEPRDENAVSASVKLSLLMLAQAVVAQLRERGFGSRG